MRVTRHGLAELFGRLEEIPGRKAVALFSAGLPAPWLQLASEAAAPENEKLTVESVAQRAAASRVTVYGVGVRERQPEGRAGPDLAPVEATWGAITDANGAAVNVTAASLVASAALGIDLDTNITDLTATNSGAGNIQIDEANGANVLNVASANGSVVEPPKVYWPEGSEVALSLYRVRIISQPIFSEWRPAM